MTSNIISSKNNLILLNKNIENQYYKIVDKLVNAENNSKI